MPDSPFAAGARQSPRGAWHDILPSNDRANFIIYPGRRNGMNYYNACLVPTPWHNAHRMPNLRLGARSLL